MSMAEEKRPFFSIVMPVYNGECYLEAMLKSIINQSFTDWELIVIDDDSRDRTPEIIEKAALSEPRLRHIVLKNNRDVGMARNRGVEEARGKYLWFADADDLVEPELLATVREALLNNPAKLTIFGLVEEYYDEKGVFQYAHRVSHPERYYRTKEELRPEMICLEQETLYGYPWNKVYELEYLKTQGVQFSRYKDAKFIEDIKFNVEYCMDIDSLNILSFCPYHYAKRARGSLTTEYVPEYYRFHCRRIEMLYDQHRYWGICTREVREILGSLYGRYILSAMVRNCDRRSGLGFQGRSRWCRMLFEQELFGELIPTAKSRDSRVLALALSLLKRKRVLPCLAMGRGIYIIRTCLPVLYSKVKSGR